MQADEKREQFKWILLLHMDPKRIMSNLETWDKMREAVLKILEQTNKFGVGVNNTKIDYDSMEHKYIMIKFRFDEQDIKKYKPDKGRVQFDD